MRGYEEVLARVVSGHESALAAMLAESSRQAGDAARLIVGTLQTGGTLYIAGNGGSAADAQHFAAEIVGRFVDRQRPSLPAVALTTDSSILTAVANDFGFENIFARQLEGLARRGDLFVGISTSGKSPNILRAIAKARALGVSSIALVGADASAVGGADVVVRVPSGETARVQEMHLLLYHSWCEAVDGAFGAG